MKFISVICLVLLSLSGQVKAGKEPASLKDAAKDLFPIGTAIRPEQLNNPKARELIEKQFNCLTAEIHFMPQLLEPQPGKFTFEGADKIVDFARQHQMDVTGHMLCWEQVTPDWMYKDASGKPLSRQKALANLKTHVDRVLEHFKGRVSSWNVVNEAVSDNAGEYLRDTPARRAIGDDYVQKVFELARAADPDLLLYYNDYNIEDPAKLQKTLQLLGDLKDHGVKVDAVGIQGHWLIGYPETAVIDRALDAFEKLKMRVMITELDVDVLPREATADLNKKRLADVNPYPNGLPEEVQTRLAKRYADIFRVLKKHHGNIIRVSFWGLDDGQSWLNDFPTKGRKNYPLLFDREFKAKPAYQAVIDVLK